MANSIFHAALSILRADLARTMGAECLAQFCHHDCAVADDVLSRVVKGILSTGDGFAECKCSLCRSASEANPSFVESVAGRGLANRSHVLSQQLRGFAPRGGRMRPPLRDQLHELPRLPFESLFSGYRDTTSLSISRKSVVTVRSLLSYDYDRSSPGQRP